MMTGKCGIISGGERDTLSGIEDCGLIIACDKGYEYARPSDSKTIEMFEGMV